MFRLQVNWLLRWPFTLMIWLLSYSHLGVILSSKGTLGNVQKQIFVIRTGVLWACSQQRPVRSCWTSWHAQKSPHHITCLKTSIVLKRRNLSHCEMMADHAVSSSTQVTHSRGNKSVKASGGCRNSASRRSEHSENQLPWKTLSQSLPPHPEHFNLGGCAQEEPYSLTWNHGQ